MYGTVMLHQLHINNYLRLQANYFLMSSKRERNTQLAPALYDKFQISDFGRIFTWPKTNILTRESLQNSKIVP